MIGFEVNATTFFCPYISISVLNKCVPKKPDAPVIKIITLLYLPLLDFHALILV